MRNIFAFDSGKGEGGIQINKGAEQREIHFTTDPTPRPSPTYKSYNISNIKRLSELEGGKKSGESDGDANLTEPMKKKAAPLPSFADRSHSAPLPIKQTKRQLRWAWSVQEGETMVKR